MFHNQPHPPNGSRKWSSISCLMERRRGGNGSWMPAVLVKAGKPKGGEHVLETGGVGHEALHNTNGGWVVGGGLATRGGAAEVKVGSAYWAERATSGMEDGRGETGEEGGRGERKAGWRGSRGVSEGERESRVGVVASPLDCYWFSVSLRVHQLFLSISCTSFLPMSPPPTHTHTLGSDTLLTLSITSSHPSPATNLFRYLPACLSPIYSRRFI